jgi:hypothetical protein
MHTEKYIFLYITAAKEKKNYSLIKMSYVINVFSPNANKTVFNVNDDSWLTHIDTNNTMSSSLPESSNSSNNERPCTALHCIAQNSASFY